VQRDTSEALEPGGELAKAQSRLLLQFDGVGEKFLNRFHDYLPSLIETVLAFWTVPGRWSTPHARSIASRPLHAPTLL
jgi:hypothetical protein